MAVGGLDILCVLPRDEVENIGIPWLRTVLEFGIPEWETKKARQDFLPLLHETVDSHLDKLESGG